MGITEARKLDTEMIIRVLYNLVWFSKGSMSGTWLSVAIDRIEQLERENQELRAFERSIGDVAKKLNKRR